MVKKYPDKSDIINIGISNEKILKRTGKVFCLFLLIVVLVNVLLPLFCRKPDEKYVENLKKTEFTSETTGV